MHRMLILRTLIFYFFVGILTLIWCPLLYLVYPLPFAIRRDLYRVWSRGIFGLARVCCGIRLQVIGQENIPNHPVIFFSKHQSTWETLVFPHLLPRNCFVCKKSLLNIPVFGWGMRLGRHIPIDRSAGIRAFKQIIAQGKKRLAQGLSIVIFPEGTRTPIRTHQKFHKTGAALVKATGSLVIPIAHNAGHYWPNNSIIKRPGTITVVIGPAIDAQDMNAEELNNQLYEWIHRRMDRIENEAEYS